MTKELNELFIAIHKQNLNEVKELLDDNFNIYEENKNKQNCLHIAVHYLNKNLKLNKEDEKYIKSFNIIKEILKKEKELYLENEPKNYIFLKNRKSEFGVSPKTLLKDEDISKILFSKKEEKNDIKKIEQKNVYVVGFMNLFFNKKENKIFYQKIDSKETILKKMV